MRRLKRIIELIVLLLRLSLRSIPILCSNSLSSSFFTALVVRVVNRSSRREHASSVPLFVDDSLVSARTTRKCASCVTTRVLCPLPRSFG